MNEQHYAVTTREVAIGERGLPGILSVPDQPIGLVIFAHGSGSSRFSPRNTYVARALNERRLATLLFDLLTENEARDRANVFDISVLGGRLADAVNWVRRDDATNYLPIGLFGASTGAAAALISAARMPDEIAAVVSRGGRPDLAGEALPDVRAATLLIVGSADYVVVGLNREAYGRLVCEKRLEVVPGATHLFEEPGALDAVIESAAVWFKNHCESGNGRARRRD